MPKTGLSPAKVTAAAAELADEVGFPQLSMGLLADRLGVKTPSLYKHVSSQADLTHRVAALALDELADTIRDATQGRSGSHALTAGAWAMRNWVREHPGRYAAANSVDTTTARPNDPLPAATNRLILSWTAMIEGYRLDPEQEIHALRTLRSLLHGYASIEAFHGFQMDTDVDSSFAWTIALLDHGLTHATTMGA